MYNKILGICLVIIFFSILIISNSSNPYDFMDDYIWEKYDVSGKRITGDDNILIKFYVKQQLADVLINDVFIGNIPYEINEQDSVLYMKNVGFFPVDSTDTELVLDLAIFVFHGKRDIFIYPYNYSMIDTVFQKNQSSYIYIKQKLPYQY